MALVGLTIGTLAGAAFIEEQYILPGVICLMLAHLGGISLIAYFVVKEVRRR